MSPRDLLKISGSGTLVWLDLQTLWCCSFRRVNLCLSGICLQLRLCLISSAGEVHVMLDVSDVSQVGVSFYLLTKSFVVGCML